MVLALVWVSESFAKTEGEQIYKTSEMNGYKLSDFADFEKKWKLVTVRYRKDTGEMRLTYANPQAFDALMSGGKEYPDGAIFGKIGIKTAADSAFPSSAVPSGARRYQFMVKDKVKFAATEGWGYVLFDKAGMIFPENPTVQTAACAACHRIVPERGYVFSQMWELASSDGPEKPAAPVTHFSNKIKFKEVKISAIPEIVAKEIPKSYKTAQQIEHEISKFLFQGTLDEIKPLLSQHAVKTKQPAFLLGADNKAFALVYIENLEIKCQAEGKSGYFMKAVSTSGGAEGVNYENRFCWVD